MPDWGAWEPKALTHYRILVLSIAALLAWNAPVYAANALPPLDAGAQCGSHTAKAERHYGIPGGLLDAISLVESGRYDGVAKASIAWPWTVGSGGDGKYFPTKAQAVAEVRRLQAAGVHNIDVGCMQVNLGYHPDAFASLDEAFEPSTNVEYAARFLKGLFESTNQWMTAASYYHSQTPSLAADYRHRLEKVLAGGGSDMAAQARQPVAVAQHSPKSHANVYVPPADASDEVRQIANAYRRARIAEYMLRREKMQDLRAGLRLARGN